MAKRLPQMFLLTVLLLAVGAIGLQAGEGEKGDADWPQWRGPRSDGRPTIKGIPKDWSKGLRKVWATDALCSGGNSSTWSAPAIAGGKLVIPGRHGARDVVFCLNAETGKEIWRKDYPAPGKVQYGNGARATPTIDGERVYTFGAMGHLACWNLADGRQLWRKKVEEFGGKRPTWGHSSSPLVHGDKVIVQGGGKVLVIAFHKATGEKAWTYGAGKAGYAAPMIATVGGKPQLVVFTAAGLVGLDPDKGRRLWGFNHRTPHDMNCATPVQAGDKLLITSASRSGIGGAALLKLTGSGAELVWRNREVGNYHADPVIEGGYAYMFHGFPVRVGQLKCVRMSDGMVSWSQKGIGSGTALAVDGHLMVLDNTGKLMLAKFSPKGFEKVTEFQAIRGRPVWTVPVIAAGKLYVRHGRELICYELKK